MDESQPITIKEIREAIYKLKTQIVDDRVYYSAVMNPNAWSMMNSYTVSKNAYCTCHHKMVDHLQDPLMQCKCGCTMFEEQTNLEYIRSLQGDKNVKPESQPEKNYRIE